MNGRLLEYLTSCVIPRSICTHHLMDAAVQRELFRLIEERAPGTRPDIDVTGGFTVVTWSGAPYKCILHPCPLFSVKRPRASHRLMTSPAKGPALLSHASSRYADLSGLEAPHL